MENLVVSVFNTESEAYQSFADLKAFRQTQTTKVAQIALVKNENGHIVEKERYDFEDSTTDATLEGGLLGAVIGLLGGPIGVFTKYDTQIVRWDVATVVAEVEAALQVQEDLYNQARAQMKAERKADRKAKLEEFKANIKSKFDKLKA